MNFSNLLFLGGIVGMIGSAATALLIVLLFMRQRKKLQQKLDADYGQKIP